MKFKKLSGVLVNINACKHVDAMNDRDDFEDIPRRDKQYDGWPKY